MPSGAPISVPGDQVPTQHSSLSSLQKLQGPPLIRPTEPSFDKVKKSEKNANKKSGFFEAKPVKMIWGDGEGDHFLVQHAVMYPRPVTFMQKHFMGEQRNLVGVTSEHNENTLNVSWV